MAIKDLVAGQGKLDIIVDIVAKGEIREFSKFGSSGKVCNAKARDSSGEVSLTLWNADIEKVNTGDKVRITNGFVSEWQGQKQLSTGRYGKLEVIGKADIVAVTEQAPSSGAVKSSVHKLKTEDEALDEIKDGADDELERGFDEELFDDSGNKDNSED